MVLSAAFSFTVKIIDLPLRYTWALSRNSSSVKQNVMISLQCQSQIGLGEAAPNIRYGESADLVANEITVFLSGCKSLEEVIEKLKESYLKACSHMAIDMAVQNLIKPQPQKGAFPISYTIPVMSAEELKSFFANEKLARFTSLKLKLSMTNWPHTFFALQDIYRGAILLDANEAFENAGELVDVLRNKANQVVLIEQPFKAGKLDENTKLKKALPDVPVFADEDLVIGVDMQSIADAFGGINVKLQKAGSFEQAQKWIDEARTHNLKIMLGCMVETTLGISAALQFADQADFVDLDSFLYLQADPYNLLIEEEGAISASNLN